MRRFLCSIVFVVAALCLIPRLALAQPSTVGYYRFPALAGDSVVSTAEGNLWRAPIS